jgi:hypothetical protein
MSWAAVMLLSRSGRREKGRDFWWEGGWEAGWWGRVGLVWKEVVWDRVRGRMSEE